MPAFNTIPAPSVTVGDTVVLANGATEAGLTFTQQVTAPQIAGTSSSSNFTLQNLTNQTATVYVAAIDATASTANYSALTDADTNQAITVASNSAINFTTAGPFICCKYGTSPTSGKLILAR